MAKIKSGFAGERAIILPHSIISEYKDSELGALLYITDMGFYPNASFHFRKRTMKEASQYILIYCVEGKGWFETENQIHKVSANQVFILPKGKAHSYGSENNKPWTIYWIHFDGEKAVFFAEGFDKPISVLSEKDSRIEERFKLLEEIFSVLKNGYSKSNLDFTIISLFYFLGSLKYLNVYNTPNNTNQISQQRDVAEEAIHYMRENVRKRISLKEIADFVGFSTSHFSHLFQRKTGHSPLNYLLHLKIQEACHLLDFSNMKINQISLLIGFEDPLYFSRVFTKTMGQSPSDYRKKKKG